MVCGALGQMDGHNIIITDLLESHGESLVTYYYPRVSLVEHSYFHLEIATTDNSKKLSKCGDMACRLNSRIPDITYSTKGKCHTCTFDLHRSHTSQRIPNNW